MNDKKQHDKKKRFRIMRILFRLVVVLFALLFALVLLLNIPAIQTFVVAKITQSISEKSGAEFHIGSVKVAFPKTIKIKDIYLQDQQADTLLYLQGLQINVDLFRLFKKEVFVNNLELENMVTHIHRKKAADLFNFQFFIDSFSTGTTDSISKQGSPWIFFVQDIHLKNIRATFADAQTSIDTRINLGELKTKIKDFDLNKQLLNFHEVLLNNTSMQLILAQQDSNKKAPLDSINSTAIKNNIQNIPETTGYFTDWNIYADQLTLNNTNFQFDNNSLPKLPVGIDYRHLVVRNLSTGIRNIGVDPEGYKAEIQHMNFTESCGLDLKKLSVDAQFTGQQMEAKDLRIETATSNISVDAKLAYAPIDDLATNFGNCVTTLDLRSSVVNVNELFLFTPDLTTNIYLSKFKNSDVFISAKADGKVDDLDLKNLEISFLKKSSLKSHARLTGLPNFKELEFDAFLDLFSTSPQDLYQFIDAAALAKLNLPKSVDIKGTITGETDSLKTKLGLTSTHGNITVNGFYQNQGPAQQDTFKVDFTAEHILAGLILSDSLLKEVSFKGEASGAGISVGSLSGKASLDIREAIYNSYNYKNIKINSAIDGGILSLSAVSDDPYLNFNLNADADLRETKQNYSAFLDISTINLNALNFTEDTILLTTNLKADLNYAGLTNSDINLEFRNTMIQMDEVPIPVKVLDIKVISEPDSLNIWINSDFAHGTMVGNINPEDLTKAFQSAYRKYFGLADTNQMQTGKHHKFKMDVHIPPDNIALLIPGLQSLNISKLEGAYHSDNNDLLIELEVPEAKYANIQFDTLYLNITGKNENLSLDLNCSKISYDSLQIEKLGIKGQVKNGKILSEIKISDSLENLQYLFANEIEFANDFYKIRFLADGFVLDGLAWNVDKDNFLEKQRGTFSSQQFVFSRDKQSLEFISDTVNQKFVFTNFAIQNLINIVEFKKGDNIFRGNLDGEIILPSLENQQGININLAINDLYILDTLAGNLKIHIKKEENTMTINSSLINNENKMSIIGDVGTSSESPLLNLDILIDVNNLSRIEHYSFGSLSDMNGKINATLSVTGTAEKPEINGFLNFAETAFKINSLNAPVKITKQKITFNKEGIHFNNFMIEDVQAKKLTLNGDILTRNYQDFKFDLNLVTQNFQPINSTAADNPVFFGKLSINTDAWLRGDFKNPKIEADIKINGTTDLTYALPGSELKMVSSEGIVYFLSPAETFDSLTAIRQTDYFTDSILTRFEGINLSVNLEIDKDAKFTVVVDPTSGDYLTIGGSAKLNITDDGTGEQSITGTYVVKSGFYQISFYNVVKKSFLIEPGGTVSWSGKPMDADINITAKYIVTTQSVALMANESSSMTESEKNMFKQRLPYEVKLNVRGLISQPEASFNITLPEKYLAPNPLIANRLAQLNTEEMASDLNKQVFALLVTGTFLADNPMAATGSSTSNVATTAARNSVNGILSAQMNKVTGKYIQFVDVNLGLTTIDEGSDGSSDPRTDLDLDVSKKLFHDRVTLEAHSSFNLEGNKNNSTSASDYKDNEFTMTYNLTKDEEYKIKTYYRTGYDLFNGEISYGGIGLVFEKEFESLKRQKKRHKDKKKKEKRKE